MKKSTLIATIAFAFTLLFLQMQMQKFPDLDKSPMDVAPTLRKKNADKSKSDL
jgi:hypothetical protein